MEERKGFLTPPQQEIIDKLYKAKGLMEAADGVIIRLADDVGLEKIKTKIPAEYLPFVYEVVDTLFEALEPLVQD